jgi:ketosteroid isomerase-like protein
MKSMSFSMGAAFVARAMKAVQSDMIKNLLIKKNLVETKQLLETYYRGLAQKKGWEAVISDDFKFVGGDMTNNRPIVGKANYIAIIDRFSRLFATMRVKEMIVEQDKASVIANYDYAFPSGTAISGDVAEIWKIKAGKLDALTIFFDTLTFHNNTR